MASDFAGFPAANIAAYFGVSPTVAQAIIDMSAGQSISPAAQQSLQSMSARFAPGGDISGGLQQLQEHPMGSHYHGDVNARDLASDALGIISGGTFNLDKMRFNVPFTSAPTRDLGKSYGNLFTGEQFRGDINSGLDSPEARIAGGLIGVGTGAAVGGALGGGFGGGVGGAGEGAGAAPGAVNPYYGGFAEMLPSQSTLMGASLGGGIAQMLGQFGGASPLSMPQMGAQPAMVQGGGSPAMNPALAGASQNDPHLGLAPRFEARQRGSREAPGLSTMPLVSEYYQQR